MGTGPTTSERRQALADALQGVAGGDRDALRQVYDATSAKLFGTVLRIVGDRDVAQDLLQDIYLKVWRRAGRFDAAIASPITWLCVIARNTAIDHTRRAAGPIGAVGTLPEVADDAPRADEFLCTEEDHEALRRCMEELQPDQRRSIRLAFFDGLTHSQLAERVGVPLGTMKSWIRRGLHGLKGCLDG